MQPSVKSKGPADAFGRPLLNLRISVTDRCNLRCRYCMPEEEYVWLPREKLLSFEEISKLAGIFTEVGIEKVRLTGGEPLLRKDLPVLVRMLAQNPRIRDLALTTNGVLLAGQAQALWDAGLHRLAVSLDTLRPDRFLVLTRRNAHAPVLRGIEAARQAGFRALKIDAVVVRGASKAFFRNLCNRRGPEDHRSILEVSQQRAVLRNQFWQVPTPCGKSSDSNTPQMDPGSLLKPGTKARSSLLLPEDGRSLLQGTSHVWDPSGKRLYYVTRDRPGGTPTPVSGRTALPWTPVATTQSFRECGSIIFPAE